METILIADDSPIIQRLLSFTLRKEGYEVLTVSDGCIAIEQLERTPIDLLIVDLAMPNMDGLEVLRYLRANPRYHTLPIIMLTASGQDEDRLKADAEGTNGFLTKPTSSRELIDTVNRLLDSKRNAQPTHIIQHY